MSIPVKIGILIACVLVIFTVALTFLVKTQVTPEKVRETLIPLIEKSLERNVDFGDVTIGLFSGISVADLKVMQKRADEEFFSVKSAEFHYQFWPLLTGKVVVDQVLLDQPRIYFTRMPDGQFNFSDLLPKPTENDHTAVVARNNNNAPSFPTSFNLLVKEVNLKSGELHYVDRYKNARSPFRYTLDNLNIKARQITFDKSFPIDLSAAVNGSNIDISGKYDLSSMVGDLVIHLAPLDLLQFAPYYRESFPGKVASAQLALNLEVDLKPDLISSKGKVLLENVDLTLEEFPESDFKDTKLSVDYSLNYNTNKQLLGVSTLLLGFNDINIGAEGEFDLSTPDDPYLVFTLLMKQLDLRKVMQNVPEELVRDYQKYSVAGLIDGQVELSGKLSRGLDLVKSVELSLHDVRASAENFRAGVSGSIGYTDKILQTENLLLQYGDQQAQLQLNAQRTPSNILQGNFVLSAETLNLNKIIPESREETQETAADVGTGAPDIERRKTLSDDIGPYDFPVDMSGTLAVKRLIYKELNLDKVSAALNLENNQFSVRDMTSQVGHGELKGFTLVDLGVKGLAYQGQIVITQPNVVTLVSGLIPETKQSVSGQLQWQNSFSGRGTMIDNLLPELKLKGEFNLQNGEAKGSPILEGLARFLGSSDLKVLSFQSLTGRYNLRDGSAQIDSYLDSSKTKVTTTGTIDIGGRLNLHLNARVAPEILEKLGGNNNLKQSFSDRDGWGNLPLQIQGTLSEPTVGYDSVALQKQMLEKATEEASQKILEKMNPSSGESAEPIKQLLDNTLNKLFGN